jgi:Ankyrin repeat
MKKLILCAILLTPILSGKGSGIFEALRRADADVVKALLDSGADPNQRNEIGATALMDAAAFSSAECVRVGNWLARRVTASIRFLDERAVAARNRRGRDGRPPLS